MSIIENNQLVIKQLTDVLKQLSNKEYSSSLDLFKGFSIGSHTRHILNFYEAILNSSSEICYDNRKRELIFERDSKSTITKFKEISDNIKNIPLQKELTIKSSLLNVYTKTTFEREMLYALDHTIHHMALLKIGVDFYFPHVIYDKNFGIAPSTIDYQKQCAQ